MLKNIIVFLFAITLFSCNDEKTTTSEETKTSNMTDSTNLTEQQRNEGWQSLFDGKTTNGWHRYDSNAVGSAWKVEDGTLRLQIGEKADWQIKDGGDIVTENEYENFHLKLEWKIDTGGNSGIMFLVKEDSKYKHPWETGPEMQVLDNERHPDAKIPKHRAGDLYDIIAVSKETVKPALEWNQVEIKVLNGKLDFWLNGENVVSTTMWDDNWNNMLKSTKWAKHPDFAKFKKGKIALQDHGNNVWFRNIMIKSL